MVNVLDIANWFLAKESMDHKKLQKLCYYAQAWSLVLLSEVLFVGNFEAWVHGPVHRELWNKFKGYGYVLIPKARNITEINVVDSKINSLLDRVWDTYGEYTGFQLENLTHSESPWIITRGDLPDYAPCDTEISNDCIRDYYTQIYSGENIGE